MWWTVLRHFAEMALLLAVLKMFGSCHSLNDAFQVILHADDISRLGVVTALAIAASGLGAILRALALALRLPAAWLWIVSKCQLKP
jgi:hypothetical protein